MNGLWGIPAAAFLAGLLLLAWGLSPAQAYLQPLDIKHVLDLVQENGRLVGRGQIPDGEAFFFSKLGPGFEVEVHRADGQIKHKCFHSVYALLAWYCETYLETGRV